ncbi:MAG: DUF3613 domain-containing protein [Pseudomonadota bacterium]
MTPSKPIRKLAVLALAAGLVGCAANEPKRAGEAGNQAHETGNEAQERAVTQWLDQQRSGESAGSRPTLGGPELQRIYDRYLESFTHPIPDQFQVENTTER